MVYFNRIMAAITAGLLVALLVLTVAHFAGVRVGPEPPEAPSLLAAPLPGPPAARTEARSEPAPRGEPGV